jgi:pyruvate/2-oxoglutarate dehydrogenase complex dihydrolipoamide acyltransferase (E2) component
MARLLFTLPDLGEGLVDAVVLEWLADVGDAVERNDPLVEVDTAKASFELPSPASGRLVERHASVGDRIDVGAALVSLDVSEDAGIIGTVPSGERRARTVRLSPPGQR